MTAKFLGIPFTVWGLLSLASAAAFIVFWPQAKVTGDTSAIRYLLLRWGHAAVWALLALAAFWRGLAGTSGANLAQVWALLALVIYLAFLTAFIRN
jgi:hypothetical protein